MQAKEIQLPKPISELPNPGSSKKPTFIKNLKLDDIDFNQQYTP